MQDVDLFAGPGGWDEGLRLLGVPSPLGIEKDPDAAATAVAAGHRRLPTTKDHPADVAALDPADYGPVRLLIASPPCQAWSRAGNRQGILDQPRIFDHLTAVQHAGRWVDYDRDGWHDDRSPLVLELVRWVDALRPELVAAEQVPDVLPFWQQVCGWLRTIGYSAVSGLLSAEQYGVPQTRQRAILAARSDGRPARLPAPSHARYVAPRGSDVQDDGLFDAPDPVRIVPAGERGLLPWVSMADALGWPATIELGKAMGAGMVDRYGERPVRRGNEPAFTVTGGGGDRSGPRWSLRAGNNSMVTGRFGSRAGDGDVQPYLCDPAARPAPTLDTNVGGKWVLDRPATTVAGDPRLAGPGHRDREGGQRQFDDEAVRVTVAQAAVLQSFPTDYPWQGNKTAQFRQVGDAVPPLLAAAVLGELLDVDWRTRLWDESAELPQAA